MLKVIEGLEEFCTPTKATKFSACIDLCAAEDVVIGAGETVLVPLGVKIDLDQFKKLDTFWDIDPEGLKNFRRKDWNKFLGLHQLNLHIRSSMSAKHGLIIANGTGIIDLDYKDEIKICLQNPIKSITKDNELLCHCHDEQSSGYNWDYTIKKGQPIAQISLVEHKSYLFGIESKEERKGGFGSTDKS